eukprot:symbB.v1.2.006344.t1/scaffold374.1/size218025/5
MLRGKIVAKMVTCFAPTVTNRYPKPGPQRMSLGNPQIFDWCIPNIRGIRLWVSCGYSAWIVQIRRALQHLHVALREGPPDKTADRRKEFELLRHLAANAFPWAAVDVLREMEIFASRKTFLKLAGGVKRRLLERAASQAPEGLVVVSWGPMLAILQVFWL